ncbi:MAG: VOC family protein [Caulobacteraceae bacterium]|nr:VOC family protein [Caulobacteraceae bacterium]
MTGARISFVELPTRALAADKAFFETAFGWSLQVFGPSYACTMTGDVDLGLQGDAADATAAPLPVIQVADLDAALASVTGAGGVVTRPMFGFPGGRRFHFRGPGGTELAAMAPDPA